MEITPYKNGIHSLAESLRSLDRFLHNENDPYLMKDVVIKSHHGLETLFKDILFQKNPVFLLNKKTSVEDIIKFYKGFYEGKNNYLFDEAKTITPSETIERLRDLRVIGGIGKKDYLQLISSFETLNSFRNQLQHFAIKANTETLVRLLGNLIPKSVEILKRCYSGFNNSPYAARTTVIPHAPLPGMEQLFCLSRDIEQDLNSFFPQATEVIKLIEHKYDVLLNEAIQKFKSTIFSELKLNIKVRDHGHCGAPPYMPNITLDGWLNELFEPHRNSTVDRFFRDVETICAIYDAEIVINRPEILKEAQNWHSDTVTKNRISIDAKILVLDASKFFRIHDVEEYIKFIKSPEIKLMIELEFEAEGMFNEAHFDIRRVKEMNGRVVVEMSSLVYGDVEEQPSIKGRQEFHLDATNTSVSFHAFIESNGKLRDNYSLELGIEGQSDLVFK